MQPNYMVGRKFFELCGYHTPRALQSRTERASTLTCQRGRGIDTYPKVSSLLISYKELLPYDSAAAVPKVSLRKRSAKFHVSTYKHVKRLNWRLIWRGSKWSLEN